MIILVFSRNGEYQEIDLSMKIVNFQIRDTNLVLMCDHEGNLYSSSVAGLLEEKWEVIPSLFKIRNIAIDPATRRILLLSYEGKIYEYMPTAEESIVLHKHSEYLQGVEWIDSNAQMMLFLKKDDPQYLNAGWQEYCGSTNFYSEEAKMDDYKIDNVAHFSDLGMFVAEYPSGSLPSSLKKIDRLNNFSLPTCNPPPPSPPPEAIQIHESEENEE